MFHYLCFPSSLTRSTKFLFNLNGNTSILDILLSVLARLGVKNTGRLGLGSGVGSDVEFFIGNTLL